MSSFNFSILQTATLAICFLQCINCGLRQKASKSKDHSAVHPKILKRQTQSLDFAHLIIPDEIEQDSRCSSHSLSESDIHAKQPRNEPFLSKKSMVSLQLANPVESALGKFSSQELSLLFLNENEKLRGKGYVVIDEEDSIQNPISSFSLCDIFSVCNMFPSGREFSTCPECGKQLPRPFTNNHDNFLLHCTDFSSATGTIYKESSMPRFYHPSCLSIILSSSNIAKPSTFELKLNGAYFVATKEVHFLQQANLHFCFSPKALAIATEFFARTMSESESIVAKNSILVNHRFNKPTPFLSMISFIVEFNSFSLFDGIMKIFEEARLSRASEIALETILAKKTLFKITHSMIDDILLSCNNWIYKYWYARYRENLPLLDDEEAAVLELLFMHDANNIWQCNAIRTIINDSSSSSCKFYSKGLLFYTLLRMKESLLLQKILHATKVFDNEKALESKGMEEFVIALVASKHSALYLIALSVQKLKGYQSFPSLQIAQSYERSFEEFVQLIKEFSSSPHRLNLIAFGAHKFKTHVNFSLIFDAMWGFPDAERILQQWSIGYGQDIEIIEELIKFMQKDVVYICQIFCQAYRTYRKGIITENKFSDKLRLLLSLVPAAQLNLLLPAISTAIGTNDYEFLSCFFTKVSITDDLIAYCQDRINGFTCRAIADLIGKMSKCAGKKRVKPSKQGKK